MTSKGRLRRRRKVWFVSWTLPGDTVIVRLVPLFHRGRKRGRRSRNELNETGSGLRFLRFVFDSCEAAIVPKPKARLCEPWETCHPDEWSPQSGRHRRSAAPANLLTLSQGSPSLALGLNTPAASQLAKLRSRLRDRPSLIKPGKIHKTTSIYGSPRG